jgi:hypothetical protein
MTRDVTASHLMIYLVAIRSQDDTRNRIRSASKLPLQTNPDV